MWGKKGLQFSEKINGNISYIPKMYPVEQSLEVFFFFSFLAAASFPYFACPSKAKQKLEQVLITNIQVDTFFFFMVFN